MPEHINMVEECASVVPWSQTPTAHGICNYIGFKQFYMLCMRADILGMFHPNALFTYVISD
jgi:hypothetical protein